MTAAQARPDGLPRALRAVRVITREGAGAFIGGGVQSALFGVFLGVGFETFG